MTRVRVSLRVPVGRPLPELAPFIARCEEAGLDGVGIHDHPSSGRDAYLAAVRRWAAAPEPGLEDEQAEESRRRRTHELAVAALPFLERFFAAWDRQPHSAPPGEHARWLRALADDLGLGLAAREPFPDLADGDGGRDRRAWDRLWQEIDGWCGRDPTGDGDLGWHVVRDTAATGSRDHDRRGKRSRRTRCSRHPARRMARC